MRVGIMQHTEVLARAKRQIKGKTSVSLWESWDIHFLLLSDITVPDSQSLGVRLRLTQLAIQFLDLQSLTELHPGFPGSPACRQQIVGLLGLHNHVS